jgi:nucleoside-diphosphate-sugar epimerase
MKVLVTGSKGFIGKYLVESLLLQDFEVLSYDISEGNDICNWELLKTVRNIDCIIHLASKVFVPESYSNPKDFFNVNIIGTLNCLEYCRLFNSRLVYVSSYLYGEPNYLPVDENHPVNAFNPYSASKIESENLCHYYYNFFKTRSIILRPFNVYGKGQSKEFLIPSIIDQAKKGLINLKDGSSKRDFIYVDDLISALIKAVKNDNILHETFNIASGSSFSVNEVVQIILQIIGGNCNVHYENIQRNNEVSNTLGDISKAYKLLDWKPEITLYEGLTKMISGDQ